MLVHSPYTTLPSVVGGVYARAIASIIPEQMHGSQRTVYKQMARRCLRQEKCPFTLSVRRTILVMLSRLP